MVYKDMFGVIPETGCLVRWARIRARHYHAVIFDCQPTYLSKKMCVHLNPCYYNFFFGPVKINVIRLPLDTMC
jgi:hypothetical protein